MKFSSLQNVHAGVAVGAAFAAVLGGYVVVHVVCMTLCLLKLFWRRKCGQLQSQPNALDEPTPNVRYTII